MARQQSDWVFNLTVRLAVMVCLGTLALGLLAGVQPVTAVTRSCAAFVAFILLAHAASKIWMVSIPEAVEEHATEQQRANHVDASAIEANFATTGDGEPS
jgi:hypothetical protein